MKYLIAFLILISPAYGSDAKISFALALETMQNTEKQKVPRSECEVCDGTGKVTAGDTVVVVTRDCTNCYDDTGQAFAEIPPVIIQVHTTKGCPPCIQTKRAIDNLTATGGYSESDFQIISGGARAYPKIVIRQSGKILYQATGYHSAKQLSSLWNKYNAIAAADEYYKAYGPEEWKEFAKLVNLGSGVSVQGMTQAYHITNHHGEWALRPEQIEGLNEHELDQIHGWQHTHDVD